MTRLPALFLAALALAPSAHAAGLQVVGSLAHDAALLPGGSQSGEIVLRNTSDEPIRARVHAQDYRFFADGSNDFLAPGTLPRSNASWLAWSPEEVVLPPGATTAVAWTMTAPQGALAGTWWSTLLVEPVDDADLAETKTSGVTVRTVVRYAVHMVAEIGHPEPDLAFTSVRLERGDAGAVLEVDVTNPGTRMLRPQIAVEVHDEDGASVGRYEAGRARIYPGCSVGFRVPLDGLLPGRYESLVVADAGEDVLFGARVAIDLTGLAPLVSRAP